MVARVRLIANPVAGGNARPHIDLAKNWLEHRGVVVDLCLTGARGDACRFASEARSQQWDRVLVLGGDGTLNEVINGLAPSEIPLAFLPVGTTNVFALEAGIPFEIETACELALSGTPRKVCLGQADSTRFLLMAGIGFDARVVRDVSLSLKKRVGKLAYGVSAIRAWLANEWPPLQVVREDGTKLTAYGVIVGNGRLYGGRFSLTPDASFLEDGFQVLLLLKGGRLSLVRYALRMLLKRPLCGSDTMLFHTRRLIISGSEVPVQIDGDYWGNTNLTIKAVYGEIQMIFPNKG